MSTINTRIGIQIIRLQSVASTNDFLQEEIKKGVVLKEGTVVVTSNQLDGKGLENNKWESAPGLNLLLSVYLESGFIESQHQFVLNKMVSLSVFDFINSLTPNTSNKIKWPNDVYINNGKVSGVLIKNTISGKDILHSIVGIGININQVNFESDAPNPISLKQILKTELNLDSCLDSLMFYLNKRYLQLKNGDFQKIDIDYLQSLYRYRELHIFHINNRKLKARIIGLGEFGRLQLMTEDNATIECDMKEVKFII